jgi:hypothetical protein
MKKIKLLLGLLIATTFIYSCSDDDDAKTISETTIAGKWIYAKEGIAASGFEQLVDHSHQSGCSRDYLEFLQNNQFYDIEYQPGCAPDTIGKGTYVKNSNTLTLTYDDNTVEVYNLRTLTDNDLKTNFEYTFEGQTYTAVTTYTKQ